MMIYAWPPRPPSVVEVHHRGETLAIPRRSSESLSTPTWDSKWHCAYTSRVYANVDSKPFRSTYYDDRMRASPALLRTRAPYLIKNTITGFAICTLVIGICMAHALSA